MSNNNKSFFFALIPTWVALIGGFLGGFFWIDSKFDRLNDKIEREISDLKKEIIADIEDINKIIATKFPEDWIALKVTGIPSSAAEKPNQELTKEMLKAVSRLNKYNLLQIMEESGISLEPEEYNKIGVMYYNARKYPEAIRYFEITKKLDSNFYRADNNLGITYNQLGEFNKAADYLKRAIEIEPGFLDSLNNLGWAYNGLEKYDEAEETLNKVIEKDTNYKQAYVNLSWTYGKTNRLDKALEALNKAIQIDPNYQIAYLNIACIYSYKQDADNAITNLEKAIEVGYDDYESIEKERDFDFIRSDRRYKKLINKLKKK